LPYGRRAQTDGTDLFHRQSVIAYDRQFFYPGLRSMRVRGGFVKSCLKRTGKDDSQGNNLLLDLCEEGDEREFVLGTLIAE
jgi:hypothetical protein